MNELRGHQILDSGPGFLKIGERDLRPAAFGVIANQQSGFVVQGIDALHGIVLGQLRPVVVFVNGSQRFANVRGIEQRTEAGDIGQILAN